MRIFVTLGTDHHSFNRLIDAVESWVSARNPDLDLLVQHGHSRPSTLGENIGFMERSGLDAAYAQADLVVAQGGPGTIRDAHAFGKRPLVVPRLAEPNESVDDHQAAYAEFMASKNLVHLARTIDEFYALADQMVADPTSREIAGLQDLQAGRKAAAARVADFINGAESSRPSGPRHFVSRARQMMVARAPRGYGDSQSWSGQ